MIVEIKGDLLETDCNVIAHGVNCQNTMKSGVAEVLFTKWPDVKILYHEFTNANSWEDNRNLLGSVQTINIETKTILNCFTQLNYGYDNRKYVNYEAIHECFEFISTFYDEIAIPKIGCGLAGGNWEIVKRIIDDATGDRCKVYVYYIEN